MGIKTTISIREKLGLTQDDMALYLQVSRGQLALYETNKRDLPSSAKLKLAKIENFLSQPSNEKIIVQQHLKEHQINVEQFLEEQAIINQHKQEIIKRKLQKIKNRYQQSVNLLRMAIHFQDENDSEKSTNTFLQLLHNQALNKIEKNGWQEQIIHEIKLQAIIIHGEQIEAQKTKVKADLNKS